jgi:hypothetical protein
MMCLPSYLSYQLLPIGSTYVVLNSEVPPPPTTVGGYLVRPAIEQMGKMGKMGKWLKTK